MLKCFWPNLLAVLKFKLSVSTLTMFKLLLFLVLVVSKWLARFSTICMRDGFVSFIVNNMFKSASCCRWVIKCFTQCMVLYCILCSKINLKYFFYEVIKSKAWIYSYCVCRSSPFVALLFSPWVWATNWVTVMLLVGFHAFVMFH